MKAPWPGAGVRPPRPTTLGTSRQGADLPEGAGLPPPDPEAIGRLGREICLAHRILPLRPVGALRPVLVGADGLTPDLHRLISSRLGPATLVARPAEFVEAALLELLRSDLIERAETQVDAGESCRSMWPGRTVPAMVVGLAAIAAMVPAAALAALLWLALAVTLINAILGATALALSFRGASGADKRTDIAVAHWPVVTLLVPILREAAVLDHLIDRLSALDYPRDKLDVLLICEEDDTAMRAALGRRDLPGFLRIVTVPRGPVRTKPRALNYALSFARGQILGIYDADDQPAPDQIRMVVKRFATEPSRTACLQSALAYYNVADSWITRAFALDYAMWFRLILPALARLGAVVPLGGTSVFFRRAALEEVGAWDAHNVTEDADLGVRLRRRGYRCALIDSVTLEEATSRPAPWIRQRARWLKGYALTWRVHMRRPRHLLRDLGWSGFLWFQFLFLGALFGFALAPVLWLYWLHGTLDLNLPFSAAVPRGLWLTLPLLFSIAVQIGAAWRAAHLAGAARMARWAPVLWPYFTLGTIAVLKALTEALLRPFWWDKTAHGRRPGPSEPPGS